jgi:glycosyltransferase involved in cell wall biosynthesis
MITRAVAHADAIVVPTEAVAEQLVTEFQGQATGLRQRIHVIGGAPSLAPATKAEADRSIAHLELPPGPFVVFVGTREPRKGLDLLIPAVARVPDLSLVLVGPGGWGTLNIQKISQESGMELSATNKRLFVTGVLDDIALATVIERARTLVMPSRAEGFGLPLVEAMHLGTPVVHSSDPALVEVAGGAGISFELDASDSKTIGLLSAAIVDAAENRHSLRAAGMQRAQAFSWGESARRIWDIHLNL